MQARFSLYTTSSTHDKAVTSCEGGVECCWSSAWATTVGDHVCNRSESSNLSWRTWQTTRTVLPLAAPIWKRTCSACAIDAAMCMIVLGIIHASICRSTRETYNLQWKQRTCVILLFLFDIICNLSFRLNSIKFGLLNYSMVWFLSYHTWPLRHVEPRGH